MTPAGMFAMALGNASRRAFREQGFVWTSDFLWGEGFLWGFGMRRLYWLGLGLAR